MDSISSKMMKTNLLCNLDLYLMRCLLKKAITLISGLSLCFVIVPGAYGVDDKRLWLPAKYSRLFLELKRAAEEVEKIDRCVSVLRGTLDVDRSTKDKPIFRVLCRQPNGKTYNEMVDGTTFELLTTVESEILDQRKEELWVKCKEKFARDTRLMKNVSFDAEAHPPEPDEFNDDKAIFSFDFSAEDSFGAKLNYRAKCLFSENDYLKLKISGRRNK